MRLSFLGWGGSNLPALLDHKDDLVPADYRPMTELDSFVAETHKMIDGLGHQIDTLDSQITAAIARLNDLKTIREAQVLALRHMTTDPRA